MKVSSKFKEIFCKDHKVPIKIFDEPYFSERVKLLDPFYGTNQKWEIFVSELEKYHNREEYYEERNRVKESAITDIKNSSAYQRFNTENENYGVSRNLSDKHIFHPGNDGRTFISIDIIKANFSVLRYYDPEIFGGANTWEEFIGRYTDNKYIISNKYDRQVILGNCNPKRHVRYEKFLMSILIDLLNNYYSFFPLTEKDIVYFSNDEVIFDVTDREISFQTISSQALFSTISSHIKQFSLVPVRINLFTLHKIQGIEGYYKVNHLGDYDRKIEFNCINHILVPIVARKFLGQEVTENDIVFVIDGLMAKLIDVPEIEVNLDGV